MEWSRVDGPGPVDFSRPQGPETWASFERPGVYTLRATARSGERTGTALAVVEVEGLETEGGPTFDAWIAACGTLPADGRGPADDPDGDGLPNLLERLLVLDPSAPEEGESRPRRLGADGSRVRFWQSRRLPEGTVYLIEHRPRRDAPRTGEPNGPLEACSSPW